MSPRVWKDIVARKAEDSQVRWEWRVQDILARISSMKQIAQLVLVVPSIVA